MKEIEKVPGRKEKVKETKKKMQSKLVKDVDDNEYRAQVVTLSDRLQETVTIFNLQEQITKKNREEEDAKYDGSGANYAPLPSQISSNRIH